MLVRVAVAALSFWLPAYTTVKTVEEGLGAWALHPHKIPKQVPGLGHLGYKPVDGTSSLSIHHSLPVQLCLSNKALKKVNTQSSGNKKHLAKQDEAILVIEQKQKIEQY